MEPNDLLLCVESHCALVAGDTLQNRGNGLQFLGDLANNVPAERAVAAEQILEGMQPLLALPPSKGLKAVQLGPSGVPVACYGTDGGASRSSSSRVTVWAPEATLPFCS
jgi:hypothetical protein